MASNPLKERITSKEILGSHLKALVELDPRLGPVLEMATPVPLRLGRAGFAGLAAIIASQMLSVASAGAIFARVKALAGEMNSRRFLQIEVADLRAAGLSRSKIACLRAAGRGRAGGRTGL